MQVTDKMIAAAQEATPRWMNATDSELRRIIEAALNAAGNVDLPVTATVRVQIDEQAFHASIADAVNQLHAGLPRDENGHITVASLQGGANPYRPLPPMTFPDDFLDADGFDDPIAVAQSAKYWIPAEQEPDAAEPPRTKLADYLIAAEVDRYIAIEEEDSVRVDWWRASCVLHDWYTTGSQSNVEDAAAEHVATEHRACSARHPRRFTGCCYLLPGHDGDHMNGGEEWPKAPYRMPVTEPRPLIPESHLHLHLGVRPDVIARMIFHREDYAPPFPQPVRHTDIPEPLYDPDAVKAWYDALPQAADG